MKNSEQSFFIDQDRNDLFSTLKGLDLQELLVEIANFNLSYRSSGLSLPQTVTMGIEIEYEKVLKEHVTKYINKNFPNWDSKADYSISLGGEVTSPILHDNLKTWQELREVCQYLKRIGAKTSQKSGGHIHIGAHILGENMEYWKQFIRLFLW